MKYILAFLVFLLPLHAFLVTVLQCKFELNTNILRFWKEIIIIWLVVTLFFRALKTAGSIKNIYKNNTLLGWTTAFIICSAIYMYFPFFELKPASVLGFRYDVFFLIAMIVWLYSGISYIDMRFILKHLFLSTFWILIVFLPWYLFWDISALATLFWYSPEVSTYTANSCISFSQNVEGEHRFQWTFGWPIRFSVFLTMVGSLFAGWILSSKRFSKEQSMMLLGGFGFMILLSIFFSYSKTSMLGVLFAGCMFSFLSYKYVYQQKITRAFWTTLGAVCVTPILLVALLKWELFLHLGSVINRLDNLWKSLEMFFYNPVGYGLGIAGPASQIGNSIESAGSWEIATGNVLRVHKFLPENWYVQILLEQWIIGFSLFVWLIILIWYYLIVHIKKHKDFMSVGITTAYFALCFMALFTHAFEEAATSYVLFLFIGILLSYKMYEVPKKKKKLPNTHAKR